VGGVGATCIRGCKVWVVVVVYLRAWFLSRFYTREWHFLPHLLGLKAACVRPYRVSTVAYRCTMNFAEALKVVGNVVATLMMSHDT
jgi:F0F1-type ATP synthase assembly protein I